MVACLCVLFVVTKFVALLYDAIIFVLDLKPHRKEEGNSDTYSFLNKLFKVQMHFSLKAFFLTLSLHLSLLFVILLQIENKNHKQNNK